MRLFKSHHCLAAALLFTLNALFCAAQDSIKDKKASYLTIQVPEALGTYPMALNNSMAITGYYLISPTVARAFLQDAEGNLTTFSFRDSLWTEPESINAAGDIAGFYELVAGVPLGFIRHADGRIDTFISPCGGAPCTPRESSGAQPVSINDYGVVAGNYPWPYSGASNGFRRSAGGATTEFGFATGGAAYPTVVTGLNSSGTIVGFSSNGVFFYSASSFLLNSDGFSTQFTIPSVEPNTATIAEGINSEGVIAGWYSICGFECKTTTIGGFVRSPQGAFALFAPPGTIVTLPESGPLGEGGSSLPAPHRMSINQEGAVTGSYTDTSNAQHGFVRGANGVITPFDPPRGRQTSATSINDSGVIAGSFYYDWNAQTSIGFLRIPKP